MSVNGLIAQGTTLEISTGTGGAKTITDISLANPTILTCSSHGLSDGDVVTAADFAGDDAASINGNSYVVLFATTDTFAIDLDSSALTITDNTDAATMTPVTYSTVGEVTDWDGPSGSAAVIDMTHLSSTAKEKKAGIPDEGQFTFSMNFDPDDTGQAAARTARANGTEKNFKVTYEDSTVQSFAGYVLSLSSSGSVDGKAAGSMTVEITGAVTTA
jgi:acetylornithine deacetylase/succinyl-diaminopimelate desuccinylase-like protein